MSFDSFPPYDEKKEYHEVSTMKLDSLSSDVEMKVQRRQTIDRIGLSLITSTIAQEIITQSTS